MSQPIPDSIQRLRDAYAAASDRLPGAQERTLCALREQSLERFTALGFPTPRLEDWKYTNVAPIAEGGFVPAVLPGGSAGMADETPQALAAARQLFPDLDAHRLVFVNGRYSQALSTIASSSPLPPGVRVMSLSQALARDPQPLAAQLNQLAPADTHAFAALNAAFFTDGACIGLERGVELDRPLHLMFLATDAAAGHMLAVRNLILAAEGSRATIVEHYVCLDEAEAGRYFTSAVTEVQAAAGAAIEHLRLQQEGGAAFHVGGLYARLEQHSRLTATAVDLGGRLVRNDVQAALVQEHAECVLNGLYVVDGRSHVDNHTHVDHARPHGRSRQFYKGVLDGRARAVFNGKIVVHPDAQHSDAQQENRNLLLSEDAEVDTRPQLEIYADDVKCSHGATVGNLDPDALFYLRSRAVDEQAARDLLTFAFAHDLLARIRLAPIRQALEQRLTTRLLHGRVIREQELV